MADMDNNNRGDSLSGSDSESFMLLMNKALSRIEKVDQATTKANNSLKEYADTFDKLNTRLENYVKLSGNVKTKRFNKGSIRENTQYNRGKDGNNDDVDNKINKIRNNSNKAIGESADLIFNAINSFGGKYSKTVTKSLNSILDGVNKTKGIAKAGKEISKYSAELTTAGQGTSGLTKIISGLGTKAVVVGSTVSALVVVLGLMEEAGRYAYERNMQLNRSLMQLGVSSDELTDTTSKSANKMIGIKNTWTRIGDDLAGGFEPFFSLVVDFISVISNGIEKITGPLDKDAGKDYGYADTRIRGYTSRLESKSGEPENKSIPTIADIASSAKQSGFSNDSAANLGIGTYDTAIKLARKYGVEASDVAKQLSDAWLSGSDAAKQYGVVVDDQVLAGFMASKGIDIVNTQITDAMKQYYRYQLLQEQTSADNSDYMQNNIKKWKQLGIQIEATKGKLFSFDEVIQLNSVDTAIPEVGKQGVSYPSIDKGDDKGTTPIIPPVLPTPPTSGPGLGTVGALNPMYVPVYYFEAEPYVNPVPVPVTVPVHVPGLELIPELVTGLAYIYGMLPMPIPLPVTVPGFEWIPNLQGALEALPSSVPVTVPVTVPGYELAPNLLQYCMQLSAQPFWSTVMFGIPSLALAPLLLGYLGEIAQEWTSKVNLSVVGQAVLERALSVLQQVRSLLSGLGQSIVTGTQRVSTGIRSNVIQGAKDTKSNLQAFGQGYLGKTNTAGLLDSWAPTSAEAYGGGLAGAIKADLDLNLVRSGLKGSTKEGYSKQQINNSLSGYAGYNLNVANKNSAANLAAKGTLASGAIASGYGLATSIEGAAASGALAKGASTAWGSMASASGNFVSKLGPAFANGGIGTKEVNNATLFEGDKKEAVIPLETTEGIRYLSSALQDAGLNGQQTIGEGITINLTLSGVNIADNDAQWEKVGKKIAEVIDVQRQRRGELNYGSNF